MWIVESLKSVVVGTLCFSLFFSLQQFLLLALEITIDCREVLKDERESTGCI